MQSWPKLTLNVMKDQKSHLSWELNIYSYEKKKKKKISSKGGKWVFGNKLMRDYFP